MRFLHIIRRHAYLFTYVLLVVAGVVICLRSYDLLLRMQYEIRGPYTWDTTIYWAIGRGILNGLMPYRDLFETKPPGIFLLSALSIGLFGSPVLGHVIQSLSIPVYPLALGWLAWTAAARGKCTQVQKTTCVAIAVLAGILLSLYTMERSGEFQVESFAALAGLLYLCLIVRDVTPSRGRMLLAAAFLACGIGMKEPFLLPMAGGAMILWADRPARLIRALVIPLVITGVTGIMLMFVLGYARPYLTIYLPEIMGKVILPQGSLWSHESAWIKVFRDLQSYAWPMGYLIIALMVGMIIRPVSGRQRLARLAMRLLFILVAAQMAVTAVAMKGNFYNHHFVFAVPVYTALLIVFICSMADLWNAKRSAVLRVWTVIIIVLVIIATYGLPRSDYEARFARLQAEAEKAGHIAQQIDAVLTACDEDHYLFIGGNGPQPYGYTTHSPYGPLFYQYSYLLDASRPFFRASFEQSLFRTSVIIRYNTDGLSDVESFTTQYIQEHFSTEPWPCAIKVLTQDTRGYTFLFRRPAQ